MFTGFKSVTTGGKTYSVRALQGGDRDSCEQMAKAAGTWQATGINRYYRPNVLMMCVQGVDTDRLSESDKAVLHALACEMTDDPSTP
jgi:hypothetical protein